VIEQVLFAKFVWKKHGNARIVHDYFIQEKIEVLNHATILLQKAKKCVTVGNPKNAGLLKKSMVG
tara:strand:- start:20006 stop:20200 length:195 start_codon:yes stop_codon:yes gene_type:complete